MRKRKVNCDYCGRPAVLIDSREIYGKSYGMVWSCAPCGAYVGIHKGSHDYKPFGRLANSHLRRLKSAAHKAFDPLWKYGGLSRTEAYDWLATKLNIPLSECHIGMFGPEKCKRVVTLCEEFQK